MEHDGVENGERALAKEARLCDWLRDQGSIAIGYSGGVDSAYLANVAIATLGSSRVLAIIGRSASFPESQWADARAVAVQIGLVIVEVDTDELNDPRYAANPNNRCYFCKTELWSKLVPIARAHGIRVVADGTNADDLGGHRPGARAAREHRVVSPLAMFEFSKDEIRERSRARGLPTWQQPSSPCLSSRIPYGTPVTVGRLKRVERAESALRDAGVVGDLRVRHFGDLARVELSPAELARWSSPECRTQLDAAVLSAGYRRVDLDSRGFRSGSLNEALPHRATVPGH
ncbi:MAG TPA: ATP-dependent sacrificial sulfur transferase LarE [Gemmatimonadaceae bacterium]